MKVLQKKIKSAVKVEELSLDMKTCPTAEQLKDAEHDPVAALMSFAVNSGGARFQRSDELYAAFEAMKDSNDESSAIPTKFQPLFR